MIDVDDELFFQIDKAGPRDVRTLDDENGIVVAVNAGSNSNFLRAGQLLVRVRHRIAHDHLGVLFQRLQQPVKTQT